MNICLAKISNLPRKTKSLIAILADLFGVILALWAALALKDGFFEAQATEFWWLFIVMPVFTVVVLYRFSLYRIVIRSVEAELITTSLYGVIISAVCLQILISVFEINKFTFSSVIIYGVVASWWITLSRYFAKGVLRSFDRKEQRKQKVAIYGAGEAGLQTAKALLSGAEFKPVVFFDDNPEKHGTMLGGLPVYNPELAFEVMDQNNCYQLLLALPSASRSRRKEIIQKFEAKNIRLKTVPGMGEIVDGTVYIEDIREVGIEDLLGRDPVPPFQDLISSCITDKVVLVTGAGGSIGSEICRQVMLHKPKKLVLFERSEFALYNLEQELKRGVWGNASQIVYVLGDVLDEAYLENILRQNKVDTVYHAAAYKHVPLVEENIIASMTNNVIGTFRAAQAAQKQKVKTFVLISTDKAVRPTNVMGATKRLAEIILQAMAHKSSGTIFSMVRFGNVLGSSGSVVPLFKAQIRSGGPVTVTHPEVTRYFMTVPEASQLVIQAGAMALGGDVFVLDMGEPIKIVDLARKMIELSGLKVVDVVTGQGDISIEFSGLRAGEKLYEELLIGSNVGKTLHPRIMQAKEEFIEWSLLQEHLNKITQYCAAGDALSVFKLLQNIIKEFQPSNTQSSAIEQSK